jgi:hypothetical protein
MYQNVQNICTHLRIIIFKYKFTSAYMYSLQIINITSGLPYLPHSIYVFTSELLALLLALTPPDFIPVCAPDDTEEVGDAVLAPPALGRG